MGKQLYEKINGEYVPIFPKNLLENIKESEDGRTLAEVLTNFNSIYIPYTNSVEETRNLIPNYMRRKGLSISYNIEDDTITEYYKGTEEDIVEHWPDDNNWEVIPDLNFVRQEAAKLPDGIVTPDKLSPALQELIKQNNSIVNLPDDEDLEERNGVISRKNKKYNPYIASGKGYKILRKNWVKGRNILTQEMINESNTIYEIGYDYDLDDKEIIIPEGSIIYYNGGSVSNGTLKYATSTGVARTGIQKGVYYLEDFVDYREDYNPAEMRDFLQKAIDYTAENGSELIFPSNKTFIVEIIPNPEVPEEQWGIRRGDGTYAIKIPSNVIIDLNDSVLQVATNKFASYNLILFDTDCNNSCIQNGWLRGDRDTHIIPSGSVDKTHEWNYVCAIYSDDSRILNCKISDVRGDGIFIESYMSWENTNKIMLSEFTDERISDKGIISPCEDGSCKLSPIHNVSYLYEKGYNSPTIKAVAETGTYDMSPFIDVHYYEDAEGNNWLGHERIFYGDMSTMIEALKPNYIRFMISEIVDLGNIDRFWVMGIDWKLRQTIDSCDIFNCGRNGIVITTSRFTLINNCHIHDIGGTNNEVGIDLEGTSPFNGQCIISNTIIERCGVIRGFDKGTSIAIPQGTHIKINDCIVDSIYGRGNEIYIKNCTIKRVVSIIPNMESSTVLYKSYTYNIIDNCRIYGSCITNQGIISNCRLYNCGVDLNAAKNIIYTKFISCSFSGDCYLAQCDYIDCVFDCPNVILGVIGASDNKITKLIRCDIKCKSIVKSTLSPISNPIIELHDCIFTQTNDFYQGVFNLLVVKALIGNTFNLVDYRSPDGQYGFYFKISNTIIANNIFKCNIANRYFNIDSIENNNRYNLQIYNNTFISDTINRWLFNIRSDFSCKLRNNKLIISNGKPIILYVSGGETKNIFNYDNEWENFIGGSNSYRVLSRYSKYQPASITINANIIGSTEERPVLTNADIGFQYYDTSLNKPIWYKGNNIWIDATGSNV